MQKVRNFFGIFAILFIGALGVEDSVSGDSDSHSNCEPLKTSLVYSQENAPRDISGVLPLIVERVNRELSGVVDVEVLFSGSEIHRRVGKHTVQCSVTRLLSAVTGASDGEMKSGYERSVDEQGRNIVTQCFSITFKITDVDECKVPVGHVMRHKCVDPAVCVNTKGSYECICLVDGDAQILIPETSADDEFWEAMEEIEHRRSTWELSFGSSLQSTCPSTSSTRNCCDDDAHGGEGSTCRAGFHCPADPCLSFDTNTCVSSASCLRAENPLDRPSFTCLCPHGLMGNGQNCKKGIDPVPVPKVGFDGVTPTDLTKKNNMYCGCTKPIVDPCYGFPKCEGKNEICTVSNENIPSCACKPGFVDVEKFGCVDESPPILKLRHDPVGDGITRLKQGESYKEHGLDVIDDNNEDYLRSLKIAYSRPLPPGCLAEIGSFQVNYTVAMPWANPPYVRVTRNVIIEDIDECKLDVEKYETQCPQLIPQCDASAGAVCKNKNGSYSCECPRFTSGDGFKFMSTVQEKDDKFIGGPDGYNGGTGCKDISKPVIKLLGPNPKVFRTCQCGGLSGIMSTSKTQIDGKNEKMIGNQRRGYEEDITKMIRDTAAAELCATHTKKNPDPISCVKAIDHTYKGDINISARVKVGDPIQVSELEWKVPYNVMDDAGNAADVVWRRILVEEVDLSDIEEKIRMDVLADRENEIKEAVRIAVEKERKVSVVNDSKKNKQHAKDECPVCDVCKCPTSSGTGLSIPECNIICEKKVNQIDRTCYDSSSDGQAAGRTLMHSFLDYFIDLTEGILSPNFAGILSVTFVMLVMVFVIQRIIAVNQGGWQYYDARDEERERELLNQVTYFDGNGPNDMQSPSYAAGSARSTGNTGLGAPPPPRNSLSTTGGIFTPPGQGGPQLTSPMEGSSIYHNGRSSMQSAMSPITPATNVHQQVGGQTHTTPYNLRRRF